MKKKDWLYLILILIAAATAITGLIQAIVPQFILGLLSAEITPTSRHFFAIVGMFMILFGGATLHALLSMRHHPVVILWSSLQKFGASVAVAVGTQQEIFSSWAYLVAVVDLLSGILAFSYYRQIRRD